MEYNPTFMFPGEADAIRRQLHSGIEGYVIGSYDSGQALAGSEPVTTMISRIEYVASLVGVSPTDWPKQYSKLQSNGETIGALSPSAVGDWPDASFGEFVFYIAEESLQFDTDESEVNTQSVITMHSGIGMVALRCTAACWNLPVDTTETFKADDPHLENQFNLAFDISYYPHA